MASHVILLFVNTIILMLVTCGVVFHILKKEYAPFLEEEQSNRSSFSKKT